MELIEAPQQIEDPIFGEVRAGAPGYAADCNPGNDRIPSQPSNRLSRLLVPSGSGITRASGLGGQEGPFGEGC